MKLFKQILTSFLAGSVMMSAGASALPVTAVTVPVGDVSIITADRTLAQPKAYPKNYLEALDFVNTYGSGCIANGNICIVQQRSDAEDAYYDIVCKSVDVADAKVRCIYSEDLYFSPDIIPKEGFPEKQEKLRALMEKYGIAEDTESLDNYFRVEVYMSSTPDLLFGLVSGYMDGDKPVETDMQPYFFGIGTDIFDKRQSDIYEFAPDCVGEYNSFIEENGNLSASGKYIIFCGDVQRAAGFDVTMTQSGKGEVKEVARYAVKDVKADMSDISDGSAVKTVIVYEPTAEGEVDLEFNIASKVQGAGDPKNVKGSFTITAKPNDRFEIVENRTDVPEWVPTDFAEALEFDRTYGATRAADGYACCVRRMIKGRSYTKSGVNALDKQLKNADPGKVFERTFTLEVPDKSDTEAYESYLAMLKKCRLTEKDVQNADKEIYYTVEVFKPEKNTTLSVFWDNMYTYENGKPKDYIDLEFAVDDGGNVTETDIFGWLPDSMTEMREWITERGNVTAHEEYVVFSVISSAYNMEMSYEGIPEITEAFSYRFEAPSIVTTLGAPYAEAVLYQGWRQGKDIMTFDYSGGKGQYEPAAKTVQTVSFNLDLHAALLDDAGLDPLVKGDCNYDGMLGVADVVALQNWLLGRDSLRKPENADIDGDGVLDVFDLMQLRKLLLESPLWGEGIVDDPEPMMVVISENFAWTPQQRITVFDQNGTGYNMVYSADASKNGNTYGTIINLSNDSWYEDIKAVMKNEKAKKLCMPDTAVAPTRKITAELAEHMGEELSKGYVVGFDMGQTNTFLIGKDEKGEPCCLEIFTTGGYVAWSECDEMRTYLKKISGTGLAADPKEIKKLSKLD